MSRRSKPYSAYEQKERLRKMEHRNSPVSGVSSLVASIVVYSIFGVFILLWYIIKAIFSSVTHSKDPNAPPTKSIFAREKTIYDLSKIQLSVALVVGILIFLYIFTSFRNVLGSSADFISGFIIAALLASLGGAFVGMILYFFNLVVREASAPEETVSVESTAPAEETVAVPPVTIAPAENGDFEIAEMNAPLYMAQFKDSLQIMRDTANPSTFFSRFDFAKERLESMAEYEKLGIKFTGSPSALIKEFEDENNIADTVNYLIDNAYKKQIQKISTLKTERGRSNSNQKWYASFEPYFDRIPPRSKEYLDLKLMELKEV